MTGEAKGYVSHILNYIASIQKTPHVSYSLREITLQSGKQTDIKESSTLSKIVKKYERVYRNHQWEVNYELTPDRRHKLIFTKHRIGIRKKDTMKSLSQFLINLDKAVKNQKVDWTVHESNELQSFAMRIKQLQRDDIEVNIDDMEVLLARSFLSNLCTLQRICVQNFKLLPSALFSGDDDDDFSFITLKKVFTLATEVVLNGCDVMQMSMNAPAVLNYIVSIVNAKGDASQNTLKTIVFKSEKQNDGQERVELRRLVAQNINDYTTYHW
eukprot:102274_1